MIDYELVLYREYRIEVDEVSCAMWRLLSAKRGRKEDIHEDLLQDKLSA